jgi:putative transposase
MWLTPELETVAIRVIQEKSDTLHCPIQTINGYYDHLHISVSIHPTIALSTWVQTMKGISSHQINQTFPDLDTHFHWQRSYAALTFGKKHLSMVCGYIERQKEHHQEGTLQQYLEHLDVD